MDKSYVCGKYFIEAFNKFSKGEQMETFKTVESTGKGSRVFPTGSVRDNAEGKGRWDLIPYYPMLRLAVHFENGAKKYGDRNWEKGQPLNEYLSSAMRHLLRFANGENQEDHLSACIWNCVAFIETERKIKERIFPEDISFKLMESLHSEIRLRILEHLQQKENDTVSDAKSDPDNCCKSAIGIDLPLP